MVTQAQVAAAILTPDDDELVDRRMEDSYEAAEDAWLAQAGEAE